MMDPSLEEAARVSKASAASSFFQVTLPVLLPAVFTAGDVRVCLQHGVLRSSLSRGIAGGNICLEHFDLFHRAPAGAGGLRPRRRFRRHLHGHVAFPTVGLSPRRASFRALHHRDGQRLSAQGDFIRRWRYAALAMFVIYFLFNRFGAIYYFALDVAAAELSTAFLGRRYRCSRSVNSASVFPPAFFRGRVEHLDSDDVGGDRDDVVGVLCLMDRRPHQDPGQGFARRA